MIKHTYLRYLLLIACFAPCASFATGTQTNCTQAVEQALRDEFEKFDQNIFDQDGIDDAIKSKMNTTLKNVMETADKCEDNAAKEFVNGHIINIDLKKHTFTFTITVTESNGNNGGNDEEHEYDDQTPTGYTSKYYLLFDNGNYDTDYKNITKPTDFTQTTKEYKFWKDDCSQKEKNPHTSRILDNRDLNKTLKEIRKILGTTARTEYVLNQSPSTDYKGIYEIKGLLLIAPNAQHDQRVVWNTTDKTKAYTVQEKIRDAFNQGSRTSCNDLRIYVLEHRIDNSTQEHKYIVHPTPVTISR